MANMTYDDVRKKLLLGTFGNLSGAAIYCSLHTSAYTPTITHSVYANLTNEVVGAGYVAGGAACASITATEVSASGKAVLNCADLSWTSSTITARYAVFYINSGSKYLLCCKDFTTDYTSTNGTFTVDVSATNGIIYLN